jgi:hypothetical protein
MFLISILASSFWKKRRSISMDRSTVGHKNHRPTAIAAREFGSIALARSRA